MSAEKSPLKNVIGRTKRGRAFLFHPVVQQADCAVAETESFLDRVFNGSLSPMLTFLVQRKKLSRNQIAELKKILDQK